MLGTSSSKMEVSLLGRINRGGIFPCALKFEHTVLVDTCDVFFLVSEALSRERKSVFPHLVGIH